LAKITPNITDNYLDSTTDKLQDAREEIKSLIEAQNAIQDKFDVTSVQENQILQADTGGVFSNQTFTSSSTDESVAIVIFNSTGSYTGTGATKTTACSISSVANPNSIITVDGSNYTLASGVYLAYTETDISGSFSTNGLISIRLKIGGSVKGTETYYHLADVGLNGEQNAANVFLGSKMSTVFSATEGLITLDVVSSNPLVGIAQTPSFTPPNIVLTKLA